MPAFDSTLPEGKIESPELADLIDAPALQSLMDNFYRLSRFPASIVDLKGKVLVGVGWQDICTKFHRVHPETCRHCIESDTQLSAGVPQGEFRLYKCKNNMWDVATPIMVGDHHVGNVFSGQFFFEGEQLDYDLFRQQARRYGFNEKDYLTALKSVPRFSKEFVNAAMAFHTKLAHMLSQQSYSNIKLARYVTERKAMERQKSDFLAMLTHDLKSPLTSILGYADLILFQKRLDGDIAMMIKLIRQGGLKLLGMVDDFLTVSKMEAGVLEMRFIMGDVRKLLRGIGEEFRPLAEKNGLKFAIEAEEDIPRTLMDRKHLERAITNLVQNAFNYTPEGGEVKLRAWKENGNIAVSVKDTGTGIPPEEQERVFDKYYRSPKISGIKGTGLGLAIAKAVAEAHGGRVDLESEPGRGSLFRILVPVRNAAAAE